MNRLIVPAIIVSFAVATLGVAIPQDPPADMPPMPVAGKDHQWLKRFLGQWEMTAVMQMEPGAAPVTNTGIETVRPIGDFWIVAQTTGVFMDIPYDTILTLGFSEAKGKFIGSWIDSFSDHMWIYEGTLDDARRRLTLDTEGPGPTGEMTKFREVTEFKTDDHRHFTSAMQGPDGAWTTFVTIDYRRKN